MTSLKSLKIVIETFVAMVIGIIGASLNTRPLKEITWASEMKTRFVSFGLGIASSLSMCRSIDEMDARLGFGNYVNRGRNIFGRNGST